MRKVWRVSRSKQEKREWMSPTEGARQEWQGQEQGPLVGEFQSSSQSAVQYNKKKNNESSVSVGEMLYMGQTREEQRAIYLSMHLVKTERSIIDSSKAKGECLFFTRPWIVILLNSVAGRSLLALRMILSISSDDSSILPNLISHYAPTIISRSSIQGCDRPKLDATEVLSPGRCCWRRCVSITATVRTLGDKLGDLRRLRRHLCSSLFSQSRIPACSNARPSIRILLWHHASTSYMWLLHIHRTDIQTILLEDHVIFVLLFCFAIKQNGSLLRLDSLLVFCRLNNFTLFKEERRRTSRSNHNR